MVMVHKAKVSTNSSKFGAMNYNNYDPMSFNNDAYTKLGFNDGGNQLWQWHPQVMTMMPTNV